MKISENLRIYHIVKFLTFLTGIYVPQILIAVLIILVFIILFQKLYEWMLL